MFHGQNRKYYNSLKMNKPQRSLKLRLYLLFMTLTGKIASQTSILQIIRISAPVQRVEIEKTLTSKGFVVPDDEWLSRALDKLSKSSKIVRTRDDHYCLSLQCLKALGTDKGTNSPDITRALDIANRGD